LITYLSFKHSGWYLNVSIWFIENILFEQKGIKLWNKWHFVENKIVIMQYALLPKYINEFHGVFYTCVGICEHWSF
jgi:hypothetical protein